MKRNTTRFLKYMSVVLCILFFNSNIFAQPGCMTIMGDYDGTGTVEIDIVNSTPCTGHDQLNISGVVTITGGTLEVDTFGMGFVYPNSPAGISYTIITGGSFVGTFGTVNYPVIAGSNPMVNLVWSITYNATSIVINVVDPCNPDATNPTFTCPGDETITTSPNTQCTRAYVIPNPTSSDNCSAVTESVTVNGDPYLIGSTVVLPLGPNTLVYTFIDAAGNDTTCTQIVTVEDNDMPIITCPPNVVVVSSGGQDNIIGDCGATVVWNAPVVSDNCPGVNATQITTPLIGTLFTVGLDTVVYVAEDAAGNMDTCSFTVTVVDDETPVITVCATPLVSYDTDVDVCYTTLSFPITATDNCGTPTYTYVANGTDTITYPYNFPVGTTSVEAFASDGFNSDSCTYTVTVEDNQIPTASNPDTLYFNCLSDTIAPNILVVDDEFDNCIANVAFVSDSLSSITMCDGDSITIYRTYSVSDTSGNSIEVVQIIVVDDNLDPTPVCPITNVDVTLDNFGGYTLTQPQINALGTGSTDNCNGTVTFSIDDDSFDCDDSGETDLVDNIVLRTLTVTDCAGNTATCSVNFRVLPVNPLANDVTSPELAAICSDVEYTLTWQDYIDNDTISTFEWSVVYDAGLTNTSYSGTQTSTSATETDGITNLSNTALNATFTIYTFNAQSGCPGDTFTVTQIINPEPIVDNQTATVCSDTPINVTLGNDVDGPSAATYDITSVDLNGLPPVSELAYSGNLTTGNQNYNERLGMVFTTNAPVSINQLGAFDSNQDGLNLPISVGIIRNSDQVVMAGPVVLSGTLQPLGADGRHRVTNILPVVLAPDTYTIVAVGYGATELNGNATTPPNLSTTTNTGGGLITYNSSSYGGIGFGYPTTAFPTADVFHAGTFQFESTSVGNGVLANAIFNDSYTNTTNAPVDVVYEVVPISAAGCAGDTFTVTVTINPEPVTDPALDSITVCSDEETGIILSTNGTSVAAGDWDIIEINADPLLTPDAGNALVGDNQASNAIEEDSYTNTENTPLNVEYVVVPVSAVGCAGDTFTIIVTVNPEPVVADTAFAVCSDEAIGYNLPDFGDNALDIDSFEISAIVDIDLGGTATEGTVTLLTAIAADVYNNVTNATQDVVYSVIPYSNGCAGDTFDITVTINPEPVVDDSTFTVCSDEAIGYDLPAIGDNNLAIDSFNVTAVVGSGLTGSPTIGSGLTGGDISADTYNNITSTTDSVIYTITPYTAGCAGDSYDLTVRVNPEPVVADSTYTVCSDEAIGYNLPVAGDNGLAIDSFNVTAVVGGGLTGIATEGTGLSGADLAGDVYNNVTSNPDTVFYTITPYSGGCAGNPYLLSVEVNPEPVVADDTITVCSDEAIGYILPSNADNDLLPIDSFSITAIVGSTLTGTATTGTGLSGTDIANDVFNNVTNAPDTVVYTITPYSGACAGDPYVLTVEVNPEPVVSDTAFSVCSDVAIGYNLPDLDDDGGDIDSFDITAVVGGGLTGSASQGNGVTDLTFIANDVFNNVTPNAIDVVYTVTPYFYGCAGDAFTVTVTIDAEPVVANQTVTVCSDVPLGINFNTDPNGPVVEFYTINSITTILTASAGNPMVGDSFAIDSIANDAWTNLTNGNQTVVYNVTPVSVDGCEGNPFTVTATIRPEPVVNDRVAETCSDVAFGPVIGNGAVTLPNSGTNIGVSSWNFDSLGLQSPLTSPFPGGQSNNPANYPFSLSNIGIITGAVNRAAIQNDAFRNLGANDADAIYYIIPVGPSPGFCLGDTFTVTGTIHPEPVAVGPVTPIEQCSGVTYTLDLDDYLTNVNTIEDDSDDDIEQVTYTWTTPTVTPLALLIPTPAAGASADGTLTGNYVNPFNIPLTVTYTVTPTSVEGCVGSTFTVAVVINPNPDVSLSQNGDNTLCVGEERTLQGSVTPNISPDSYDFEYTITAGTGTLTNANTISATVTPTAAGPLTIQFKATNPNTGCSDSISYTFTVNPNPVITVVEDTLQACATVLNGLQGIFDLTSAVTGVSLSYHVSESDAEQGIGAIGNPTNYTGNDGQEIWVRSVSAGCYSIEGIILEVNNLPIVAAGSYAAVCVNGDDVTLAGSPAGGTFTGTGVTGNTFSPSDAGAGSHIITYQFTDANGCSNSATTTIVVNPTPNGSITASDLAVCYGQPITLTANGGDVVVWSTGDTDNPIVIYPEEGDTTISVVLENVFGCLDTTDITVSGFPISDAPDVASELDTCALIFGGSSAEFDLTSASDSLISFHLTESDALNGVGEIINPENYTGSNGQLIWWSYLDSNVCSIIGSFVLVVNPLPVVGISASSLEICVGDTTIITATGGGDYEWSNMANTDVITVSPSVNTTYTVTVTDANGCENTASIEIVVNPNPVATITGSDLLECNGSTVTLEAGGGDSYVWFNGVGNTASVNVTITSDTTFTVEVTNAFGCVDTTSIEIEVSPELVWDSTSVVNVTCNGGNDGEVYALATGGTSPLTYAWEDGDGNDLGTTSSLTGLEAGSYHLTVTDAEGCEISTTLQVTEPDALAILNIISNDLECNGDSTGNTSGTISGGVGPYTIYIEGSSSVDTLEDPAGFYFENLAADNYLITVVDSNGCEATTVVEIAEPTPLLIAATPQDADCNGGNGTITVSGSGGTPGYTYFVNFPVPNTPANSPSFEVPAGTYTVHIEDTNSCRDSIEVTIGEPTAISVDSILITNESCDGSNDGTASVYVSGGTPGYTYDWSNNQSSSIATGLGEGVYYVTITDINGCEVIDSVEIGVDAAAPPAVVNCPSDITFYVLDCDISYSYIAPTIVDNCLTTQLTVDLDGAEDEGFTLGIQQVNFEPGVYNITYTDETADPDTIACAFTVTVIDSIAPVIVCPDTVQVQCVEDKPVAYTDYLDFIADGGILDDNCTVNLSSFAWVSDTGLLAPECTNRDTITRIYSVEDIYGNTGLCEQTIVVYDTIAPTITLPADTIVNCDAIMTPAQLGSATADDNCDLGSVTIWNVDSSNQSGDLDSCDNYNYTITRTWYAEDECGNLDSLDQIILVQDTTKPVPVCVDTFLVYLDNFGGASIDPEDINNGSSDNCMPANLLNLALSLDTFTCAEVPYVETTLYVKDACGNTNTCTAVIEVADTIPPVAICQSDITIYLDSVGNVSIDSSDLDNGSSDNCAIQYMILSDAEFDCDDVSPPSNLVYLYVIDFYNNADTCTTNVHVLDTIRPEVFCQDITVQLDSTGVATITPGMINNGSNDACGIDTMTVSPNSFDCDNLEDNTVVLTVTDVNGNSQTCSANVTVADTIRPIAVCTDITVSLDSLTGTHTLTSADSTLIVAGTWDNCSFITDFIPNSFDCDDVFAPVAVFIRYSDPSANTDTCTAYVTVEDITPPTPVCADITVSLDSTTGEYVLTAGDSSDIVNATFDICGFTTEFSQDTFSCEDALSPVIITVTYTDPSGNTNTCNVSVTVEDNFAPTPICSDYTIELDSASGQYILNAIDSSEIVDGTFDACGFVADFSRDTFYCSDALAPVTITVTYEDPSGNTSTCTADITVEDNFAPAAICNDITVELDSASGTYTLTPADSSEIVDGTFDACGFTVTIDPSTFSCADTSENTVLVTYTDPSGNESECEAVVTVLDVTPPTAVCNDITISLDSTGNYTLTTADSSDIVDGTFDACTWTYTLDTVSFNCSDVGVNVVTVVYTDPSDNTSTCTLEVTVTDTIAPVIVCQDTVISLDQDGEASITAEELVVSALDACGIDTMIISQTDYDCGDIGANTRIITVTDVNGNAKTCSVIVTVTDTLAPIFTLCNGDSTIQSSPTGCFASYGGVFVAEIIDNCTAPEDITVTATALVVSSNQLINLTVTPVMGGGYTIGVPAMFGFSLPVGENTITVYAEDEQGNIDSCQWTVEIEDVWSPSVQNCPANITIPVNPATCTAQAFWGGPTASDNCSGVSLMTQNGNQWFSGAFFPLGETIVQYTATDASGNTNTTCSFTVTVTGTCTPPAPDLSPEHITGGTNYNVGQMRDIVVRVRNLSPNPTTAPVVFYVQKMNPNFTISVNPTQTSATVGITNYTVSNPDWDVLEQPTRWRFTSKPGVIISGNTQKLVAVKLTANNFPMSSANLTTTIQAGSGGGETPTSNNIKTNILLIN